MNLGKGEWLENEDKANGAHSEDVRETVFLGVRLLHDGGELVEVEQRDDGLGGEEGDDGDVHLQERRRGTLCVILRKFGGARSMTRQVGVARRNKKKFKGQRHPRSSLKVVVVRDEDDEGTYNEEQAP